MSQEVNKEWTPGNGVVAVVPESESLSFFDDDEGDNLYSFTVILDGQKIRARELTKRELTEYNRLEMNVAEAIQAVASKDQAEAERAVESVPALQAAAHDYVVDKAVSGWELKRPNGTAVPCTAEAKKKLRASKKAELVDRIVQRSQIGRELQSFLTAS